MKKRTFVIITFSDGRPEMADSDNPHVDYLSLVHELLAAGGLDVKQRFPGPLEIEAKLSPDTNAFIQIAYSGLERNMFGVSFQFFRCSDLNPQYEKIIQARAKELFPLIAREDEFKVGSIFEDVTLKKKFGVTPAMIVSHILGAIAFYRMMVMEHLENVLTPDLDESGISDKEQAQA